jgi:hypothetical protein
MDTFSSTTTITLDYPDDEIITGSLHLPFAPGRNRATSEVEAGNLAWLAEHGLLVRGSAAEATLSAGRFHELAGHVYRTEDREALQITADFIAALFFFDDLVDTNQSRLSVDPALALRAAGLLGASVRSGEAPSPDATEGWHLIRADREKLLAIAAALADVSRRLVGRDPVVVEPFFRAIDAYLESMAREAAHRHGRAYTSLGEYASVRSSYSAVYTCIELGLALRGVALSAETRGDLHFQQAMESANLSVSYVNDLFSYKRESLHGERSNLVMVIEHVRGAPRSAAFAEACRMANEVVDQFLVSRAALDARGPAERAATELFESWIRGNYDWHAGHTQRYVRALSTHAPAT